MDTVNAVNHLMWDVILRDYPKSYNCLTQGLPEGLAAPQSLVGPARGTAAPGWCPSQTPDAGAVMLQNGATDAPQLNANPT